MAGEALYGKGKHWDGYMEILRAESLSLELRTRTGEEKVDMTFLDNALNLFRERVIAIFFNLWVIIIGEIK